MAEAVYVLCALTSAACAFLLVRGYLRARTGLLLWSGLCFSGLAVNNIVLFIDKVVITEVDLSMVRATSGFLALLCLVYGLVTEAK